MKFRWNSGVGIVLVLIYALIMSIVSLGVKQIPHVIYQTIKERGSE